MSANTKQVFLKLQPALPAGAEKEAGGCGPADASKPLARNRLGSCNLVRNSIMKNRIPLRMLALAGLLLALTIPASKSFALTLGQTSIGYVDQYGNGVLTVADSVLEAAFTDELNHDADDSLHNATISSVSIIPIGGTYYLVGEGSSDSCSSIIVKVVVTSGPAGLLKINDNQSVHCSCGTGGMDTCPADCSATIICPCNPQASNLYNGANHLGNFY